MTCYMGPETPRPFAVISEHHQRQLEMVKRGDTDVDEPLYSFGAVYNKNLSKMIAKYTEANIDDRFCYIGPVKGSISDVIESEFTLIYPCEHVVVGKALFEDTPFLDRTIPVQVVNIGAEEYFKNVGPACKKDKPLFHKVVMRDALEFIEDRKAFYDNVMSTMEKNGKLLILHRSSKMLTLPYYQEAKKRIAENDVDFMAIIADLQDLGYEVEWEVEVIPAIVSRLKWLSLLYHQYPNHLELTGGADIYGGLRELTEGSLKYSDDAIEIFDRMLVICVSQSEPVYTPPKRYGGSDMSSTKAPLLYRMAITPDIKPLTVHCETVESAAQDLEKMPKEWWGTVSKKHWGTMDSAMIPPSRLNTLFELKGHSRNLKK